jgi:anti-anti-sigma factor
MFEDGALRITRTFRPPGLRLTGEVDMTNAGDLGSALAAAVQDHRDARDLYVDLAQLEFISVDGLRRLVETAAELGSGRRLVLRAIPGELQRVLHLMGWDAIPGLLVGRGGEHER